MAHVRISVVFSPSPREVLEFAVSLAPGSRVLAALDVSGLLVQFPGLLDQLSRGNFSIGIWSKPADLQTIVKDSDRIEVCRPLQIDPKAARRERFKQQGSQRAGLFARPPKPSQT